MTYSLVIHPVAHTLVANELGRSNRIVNQRKLGWITSKLGSQKKHEQQDWNLMGLLYHKGENNCMPGRLLSGVGTEPDSHSSRHSALPECGPSAA